MKTPRLPILLLLILGLAIASLLTCLVIGPQKKVADAAPKAPEVTDDYQVIQSKLSKEQVKSRWSPVHIWRTGDNQVAIFTGSGVLYNSKDGEEIITSEHLFLKHQGKAKFFWRKLRPLDEKMDISNPRGISEIVTHGDQLSLVAGSSGDAVILKPGIAKTLECFSLIEPNPHRFSAQPFEQKRTLTSLLSGEKVTMVGTGKIVGNPIPYMIIDYASVPGESGSGFVDEDDKLYILKGSLAVDVEHLERVQKAFGTTKGLSWVYGAFEPK